MTGFAFALRLILVLLCLTTGGTIGVLAQPAVPEAPVKVKAGLHILSISKIDTGDSSFHARGFMWFVDPSGNFDMAKNIEFFARQDVINEFTRRDLEDGSTYTAIQFEATFDQAFDVRSFPFDRQTLAIPIETAISARHLLLVPDRADSGLSDLAVLQGWEMGEMQFREEIVQYRTSFGHDEPASFARLTFLVPLERIRSPLIIEKFVGFTVALLIVALIYFVPTDQFGVRLGMVTSSIFAAVGNRYSLDSQLGSETAFGLADKLTLITFGAIYTALLMSLVAFRLTQYSTAKRASRVDYWAGLVAVTTSFSLAIAAILEARG